jgi:hypothetical protein
VRRAAGVGKELLPLAILPIGYAGERPEKTTRRPLDELVHEVGERPPVEPALARTVRHDIPGSRAAGHKEEL